MEVVVVMVMIKLMELVLLQVLWHLEVLDPPGVGDQLAAELQQVQAWAAV